MKRTIAIVRDHGLTIKDLLKYDVTPFPLLFNDDGMVTNSEQSQLLKELETYLKAVDNEYGYQRNSSFVIDIMATICKVCATCLFNSQDLLSAFV